MLFLKLKKYIINLTILIQLVWNKSNNIVKMLILFIFINLITKIISKKKFIYLDYIGMIIIICISIVLDYYLIKNNNLLTNTIILTYCLEEITNILKTLKLLKIKIPSYLINIIKKLKETEKEK